MAQVFPSGANTLAKASLVGALLLPAGLIMVGSAIARSPYSTGVNMALEQPIPFSHAHHVNELGIDCRYCHSAVDKGPYAGIPPTHTCMTCHSQIWTNSPLLEPLRESYRSGAPIMQTNGLPGWNRVNKLPEFVYFDHSIHVNRGINCNVCHGPVHKMQITYKGKPFFMSWCVSCHRNPEGFVRPRQEVFEIYSKARREPDNLTADERALLENQNYQPSRQRVEEGKALMETYGIRKQSLADCWVCHR